MDLLETRVYPRTPRKMRVTVAFVLTLMFAGATFLAVNWPFTKQRLIDALQQSTQRTVTISEFHRTYFPPGCVAGGINFLHSKYKGDGSLITIQRLTIEGDWHSLFVGRHHLDKVVAVSLHIFVPPRGSGSGGVMPITSTKGAKGGSIDEVIADGSVLEFISLDRSRQPYRLDIERLRLKNVGGRAPILFSAVLENSKPPGQIESQGTFGPWNKNDPAATPVSGSFTYRNVNLGALEGIAGMLDARGSYRGTLDHIDSTDEADVPDFHVKTSAHTVHVTTKFKAVVNATDGDTSLEQVETSFGRTTLLSQGTVAGVSGTRGKFVDLKIASSNATIDDLLRLVIKAPIPPMLGAVRFQMTVSVPPYDKGFLQKLRVSGGDFGIGEGRFSNPKTEASIVGLAESAKHAKKNERPTGGGNDLSDLSGHLAVAGGVATLSNLRFSFPGSNGTLHGTFNLISREINLHGLLRTDGSLAAATSGIKALFANMITPLLKKKSHVKIVPFKITGTYGTPKVALDL